MRYTSSMSDVPAIQKRIAMDAWVHKGIEILADQNHRTLSGQLAYLVEQELKATGISIDPDTLEPAKLLSAD